MLASFFEPVLIKIVKREFIAGFRKGFAGFRLFLTCITLGVMTISAVMSLSQSVLEGIKNDGRRLLGGDLELVRRYVPLSAAEQGWIASVAQAYEAQLRANIMAIRMDGSARTLVTLRAVETNYPLVGEMKLQEQNFEGQNVAELFADAAKNMEYIPMLVEPELSESLSVNIGEILRLGDANVKIVGIIESIPDVGEGFLLGPRIIVPAWAIARLGLDQAGALTTWRVRLIISDLASIDGVISNLDAKFPKHGFRILRSDEAARGVQQFVNRAGAFLGLVGLASLLVGCIGVYGAMHSYLGGRLNSIATMKILGASEALLFRSYFMLIIIIACIAIVTGAVLGAVIPFILSPLLAAFLPAAPDIGIHAKPMLLSASLGLLVVIASSALPLSKACNTQPAQLFRNLLMPIMGKASNNAIYLFVASLLGVIIIEMWQTPRLDVALWFLLGTFVTLGLLSSFAFLLIKLLSAGWLTVMLRKWIILKLAVSNICRPGANTGVLITALGLGLTTLSTAVLTEQNLTNNFKTIKDGDAPAYFLMDIKKDQLSGLEQLLTAQSNVSHFQHMPMLRARVLKFNGVPVEQLEASGSRWVIERDRGITWAKEAPEGMRLVSGAWWPADYSGPLQVSMDHEVAEDFNLALGDTLTVDILGRPLQAKITSFRNIKWENMSMNFVFIFSPGALEAAPAMNLATVHLHDIDGLDVPRLVTDAYANITVITVKDILDKASELIFSLSFAIQALSGLIVISGILVLVGALVASKKRRVIEIVIFKLLGATKPTVLWAMLWEYALLGSLASLIALVISHVATWGLCVVILSIEFTPNYLLSALVVGSGTIVSIAVGIGLSWMTLHQKPAPYLRNQ